MYTFIAKYYDYRQDRDVTEQITVDSTVTSCTEAEIWGAAVAQALEHQEGKSFEGIELLSC